MLFSGAAGQNGKSWLFCYAVVAGGKSLKYFGGCYCF